jgi:GNAT superfamily N-acetyltransferase
VHDDTLTFRAATASDRGAIARLRFQWRQERGEQGLDEAGYRVALEEWMAAHEASHLAFVALRGPTVIAMAWLAIVERIPGPEHFARRSGDVQSVYVDPAERGRSVGTQLVQVVVQHARELGLAHLSLHPSERSVPMYERLGFESADRLLYLHLR